MSNIIHFPAIIKNDDKNKPLCHISKFILNELNNISSDAYMNKCILERMKPFIESLDYDLGVDVDITGLEQNAIDRIVSPIQSLQKRFDDVILEIISERILREVYLFHVEGANNK